MPPINYSVLAGRPRAAGRKKKEETTGKKCSRVRNLCYVIYLIYGWIMVAGSLKRIISN